MNHLLWKVTGILFVATALFGVGTDALAKKDIPVNCPDANKSPLKAGDIGRDLKVVGLCEVPAGEYKYVDVNIVDGGILKFADAKIDFWAANIVVESGGTLEAGSESTPIGTAAGAKLTIHLYGADQITPTVVSGQGVLCLQERCGIPVGTWESNGSKKVAIPGLPNPDYFYQYGPLMYDGAGQGGAGHGGAGHGGGGHGGGDDMTVGYFGYKVLAVSFNGTLKLFGKKGAKYGNVDATDSGTSWMRLKGTVNVGATKLVVERPVYDGSGASWAAGDRIVLTATDYLPGHSEELEIVDVDKTDKVTITFKEPLKYRHQGEVYQLPADTSRLGLGFTTIETRAAVALLSRSIQIVSEGPQAAPDGFKEAPGVYFGAHMIARQGFKEVKIQGVEFKQMGQGGRIGRYPVHFHHAMTTPSGTYVKDSSINESMTRFIVLHGTNNVTLARNVGWKSIGHGFYIEDGSEVDNKLLTNIGIYARPAIQSTTVNPRLVPGILAADRINFSDNVPFHTDVDHPTVFWIMNAWNDFQYNMAAGAGTCGTCYWLLAGANSGMSRDEPMDTNLTGYAAIQASTRTPPPKPPYDVQVHDNPLERAGLTPLRSFVGNSCTAAMNSFNTVGNVTPCYGSGFENPFIPAVKNPMNLPRPCNQSNPVINKVLPSGPNPVPVNFTPDACANPDNKEADDYYPKVDGGIRQATLCDDARENCRTQPKCAPGTPLENCAVTIIDRFTSSFHMGAELNFGAMWLRGPGWFLVTNSALTDVQNAGLSIVSGGGYTESDLFPGRWALVRKTVFVGSTQDHTLPGASGFASPYGPFNPKGVAIEEGTKTCNDNHCISVADGLTIPISNFGMNQRMFSIYDGPTFQDSNAYLDIKKLPFTDCNQSANGGICKSSTLSARVLGVPYDPSLKCYMPNAAIAWKQPNGFYYPPAFHSRNLYFGVGNVDIRHFVIEPIFEAGTYKTKVDGPDGAKAKYCNWNSGLFNGYTDVDRQTELSDDDGSLTGRVKSVSVNNDSFFTAPVEETECESDDTAKTSPYDYVTSVVYPKCATDNTCCPHGLVCEEPNKLNWFWAEPCTSPNCYGVPIYRQLLTNNAEPTAFMKMAGQATYQRSTMTPNNGKFYIDTTVSYETQKAATGYVNTFLVGETYYLFLLYATPTTTQTYQIYVGEGFEKDNPEHLWATRAKVQAVPFTLDPIADWPTGWTKEYADGVLTVTMKMDKYDDFKANYKAAFEGNCQPRNFCSWSANDSLPTGGTCGCNGSSIFSKNCGDLNNAGENVCAWAQKDVDCPKGGCYGFGFKMANVTYGVDKRPKPDTYPPGPPWTIPWTNAAPGLAQSCTPKTKVVRTSVSR